MHIFTVIESGVCAGSSVHLSVRSLTLHSLATTKSMLLADLSALETCRIIFGSWQSISMPKVRLASQSRCLPDGHRWLPQMLNMVIA